MQIAMIHDLITIIQIGHRYITFLYFKCIQKLYKLIERSTTK